MDTRPGDSVPDIDVVVAVHDVRREIRRCVDAVLNTERAGLRVTVVAHGLERQEVLDAMGPSAADPRLRVVPFSDGVASPAGPFNVGIEIATGRYVAIIGSDDYLDDQALDRWHDHCEQRGTDYLLAPLRNQDGARWRDPLARPGRRHRLDAAKDRLNYRAAPLGLIRRSFLHSLGVTLTEGLGTGEDIELGLALVNRAGRVDFDPALPAYVIGQDAPQRVTSIRRSLVDEFGALAHLRSAAWLGQLDRAHRRAIAVKLWRMNVVPAVLSRTEPADWADADLAALGHVARWLADYAPGAVDTLSRAERAIPDAVLRAEGDRESLFKAVAAVRAASGADRAFTARPWHVWDRDAMLRRSVRLRLP